MVPKRKDVDSFMLCRIVPSPYIRHEGLSFIGSPNPRNLLLVWKDDLIYNQ